MYTPARSAAAMIISPLSACTERPSRVMVTLSGGGLGGKGARPFLDVDQELVAEHPHPRHDGARDRRAERADRRLLRRPRQARGNVVTGVEQQVQVGLAAPAGLDALQDLLQPPRPLPARGALPAGLLVEEPG